ncbi:hypothetical protein JRO89_XS01G0145900 [Xanthoceras sorbifolium]|uniref:SET domain-containing protein n=1 Tax=Xanthoceras sorbifolium TaxID=99658 RepID=A0ABQ8IJV4_9ROSI|nr:hypothetical protein JRO89_XS01G0145900 [Xanthoceras sorbifolium]
MAESSSLSPSKEDLIQLIKRFGAYLTIKMSNLFSISFHNLDFNCPSHYKPNAMMCSSPQLFLATVACSIAKNSFPLYDVLLLIFGNFSFVLECRRKICSVFQPVIFGVLTLFYCYQDSRSVGAIAGLALAIVFTWRLVRSPGGPQRRQPKRQAPTTSTSVPSTESNATLIPSGVSSPPEDLRAQNVVDEFFQPVTCRLLGVVLEESSPEEIQAHQATVRSSVLEVLLEITKFCDLYLMERVLDDEKKDPSSFGKCGGFHIRWFGQRQGVYADADFEEGELVLKDPILVGMQHSSNKFDCLVCSSCFRFVGSIELQIGRKLYFQSIGVSANGGCDGETFSRISKDCYDASLSHMRTHENLENCASSSSSKDDIPVPKKVVDSLMNGGLVLPHSTEFPLPSAISCPGGCKEAYYCSKLCAEADWKLSHSLLCTGERSKSLSREALSKFIQHANGTNDIFLLAAKVICFTILRYRKLKADYLKEQEKCPSANALDCSDLSLLLEAWKPISFGHKRRWWDCIALPDDVDSSDEASFRMEIRELANTKVFSLEIYGHIIGMFELNNLDLVVASPVEDYFLYIDDLPEPKKKEAEIITRPILDALGDDYSVCCEGTAFFPLQSCMNHSCCPNAKAFKREKDRDGQATIIALRPIRKGEEVTISYIDEDLPYEERQASLADYGFKCKCFKCLEEQP